MGNMNWYMQLCVFLSLDDFNRGDRYGSGEGGTCSKNVYQPHLDLEEV